VNAAELVIALLDALPDDCIGACSHGTDVSENPWQTYDEDGDVIVDYDLKTQRDHLFVLEAVKLQKATA
jgi:hypothetical protein